jgi:hypothetical protein
MPEILSLRSGPDNADGSTVESSVDVLYVRGGADADGAAIKQLESAFGAGRIKAYANSKTAANAVLARGGTSSARALVTSPGLNNQDTTQLISKVREGSVTLAVVPIVTAADQGLRAIAAGADAVLLFVDGALVEPRETLLRVLETVMPPPSPPEEVAAAEPAPSPTVSAGRRMLAELKKLQGFLDMGRRPSVESEADNERRVRLKARLDEALDARVRLEGEADQRGQPLPWASSSPALEPTAVKAKGVSPFAAASPASPAGTGSKDRRERANDLPSFAIPLAEVPVEAGSDRPTASMLAEEPAVLQTPAGGLVKTEPAPAASVKDAPPVPDGRAELDALTRTLESEREAWATDRGFLEIRIADLEAAAGSKRAVEAALEDARAELARYTDQHASERNQWIAERNELLARIEELASGTGATSELESALQSSRTRLDASAAQHAADRHEWEATRQALDARISELEVAASAKSELEAALQVARTQFQAATERQTGERATWSAERQRLEQRIGELEVEASSKGELEAALNAARAELEQVVKGQGAQRSAWAVERRQLQGELESRAAAIEAATAAKEHAERALETARVEWQQADSAHTARATEWDDARRRLESELAAKAAAADAAADAEAALQRTVDALRSEVRDAVEVYNLDKDAWEQSRVRLEERIRTLEAEVEERDRLRESLREAEAEVERLGHAHQALTGNLGEARSALDRLAEEALSLKAKFDKN